MADPSPQEDYTFLGQYARDYVPRYPAAKDHFYIVLSVSRYAEDYALFRINMPFNKHLIAGLAKELSDLPLTEDQKDWWCRQNPGDEEYIPDTLGDMRFGAMFYDGYRMGSPGMYWTQYGS